MNEVPAVSITILLYNSAKHLRECFDSIREDVLNDFAELLVVNNASPDESAEIVALEFPKAKVIHSDFNRGFAGGCNLAWPYVQGRYWLLLNPDVVVPERGLHRLVEWMDEHPELGIASPEIVDTNGGPWCPGRRFPSIGLTLLEVSRLHHLLPAPLRGRLMRGHYWRGGDQLDVDWVPGAVTIARRQTVEDAGLLSEHFFMYGEDIEWCWRIHKAGWRVGVLSQPAFQHHEGSSSKQTWGLSETRQRIVYGLYDACRQMHGSLYSKAFVAAKAFSFVLESFHPFRSINHRSNSRDLLDAHISLLRRL